MLEIRSQKASSYLAKKHQRSKADAPKVADRGGAHCQLGVVATVESTRLEMALPRKLCLWKINKWFWY